MLIVPRLGAAIKDLLWLREPSSIVQYLRTCRRIARRFRANGRKKPVLLFQNGKVGSQTVLSILASRDWPVLHTHHATLAWMKEAVDKGRPGVTKSWTAARLPQVRLVQHLVRGARKSGLKIIVPFRDPIARSLSLCFHANGGSTNFEETEQEALGRLRLAYEEHFWMWVDATPWEPRAFLGHDHFDGMQPSWYERELKSGLELGVDILASDLTFSEGYQIVSFGTVDVLILKMEAMDRCLPRALKVFLGLDFAGVVERQHVQRDGLYRRFCEGVRIAEPKMERLLRTEAIARLFTEEERVALRKRWVRAQ